MNGNRNGSRFQSFMAGRYGMDQLNRFIMYVALALVIIGLFVHVRSLTLITVILLIILYCRMFSRSIYKRQQENMKFLQLKERIMGKGSSGASGGPTRKDRRAAKQGKRLLICPYCKEKLRVPVGAGKIKVRCPHCKREFEETV